MLKKYINSTSKKIVATTLAMTFAFSTSFALIPKIEATGLNDSDELWEEMEDVQDESISGDSVNFEEIELELILDEAQAKMDEAKAKMDKAQMNMISLDDNTWAEKQEEAQAEYEEAQAEYEEAQAKLDEMKRKKEKDSSELIEIEEDKDTEFSNTDVNSTSTQDELLKVANKIKNAADAGDEEGMELSLAELNEANTELQLANAAKELIKSIESGDENAISVAVENVNEASKDEDKADEEWLRININRVKFDPPDDPDFLASLTKAAQDNATQAKNKFYAAKNEVSVARDEYYAAKDEYAKVALKNFYNTFSKSMDAARAYVDAAKMESVAADAELFWDDSDTKIAQAEAAANRYVDALNELEEWGKSTQDYIDLTY